MSCPVCDAAAAPPFFVRRGVPVHQNSLLDTEAAARGAPRGDLELAACGRCGFVFNAAFDAARVCYDEDYENSQDWSPVFERYLDDHVARLAIRGANIVEVGCGKGRFLKKLVAADPGNCGWGFDPSYLGPDEDLDGRVKFRREFFGSGVEIVPDVVVCRHVIEHVADPVGLLKSIHVPAQKEIRIFFETPCFEWILRGAVFWDVFYEHCNYFTAASLRAAFERAGYSVQTVTHVFGGQYLWVDAGTVPPGEPRLDAHEIPARAAEFARRIRQYQDEMRLTLERYRSDGLVAVWGAGAKGVTFANVLDPERRLIRCLVDINQRKQGKFIAGTGHEIVAPEALAPLGVRHVIVMNPNYTREVATQAAGLRLELHTAEASECA